MKNIRSFRKHGHCVGIHLQSNYHYNIYNILKISIKRPEGEGLYMLRRFYFETDSVLVS